MMLLCKLCQEPLEIGRIDGFGMMIDVLKDKIYPRIELTCESCLYPDTEEQTKTYEMMMKAASVMDGVIVEDIPFTINPISNAKDQVPR